MYIESYKSDEAAEFHFLHTCKDLRNENRLVCMVCGEDIPREQFANGATVTCPDCGIFLEEIETEEGKYLVHFTSEENATCAEDFYGRIK